MLVQIQIPADYPRLGNIFAALRAMKRREIPLPQPQPVTIRFLSEGPMPGVINYEIVVPASEGDPAVTDVFGRILTIQHDGVEQSAEDIGRDSVTKAGKANQGVNVKALLQNYDDGDPKNLSVASVAEGLANVSGSADTTAPAAPDAVAIRFVSEE